MESLIKSIAPYLAPIDLMLLVIIGWQFISAWKREKVVASAFKDKDTMLSNLFEVINSNTHAVQKLAGFLDGQRGGRQ